MCGIAAYASRDSEKPETQSTHQNLIRSMIQAVRYRGPDGEAFHSDPHCSLGFTHLQLVGRYSLQPLQNETGTVFVVCNGEIYNHEHLKRSLSRSHDFRSDSDCEILIHLYEDRGTDFVHHLKGQYAFVLWDQREQILLAARDRFGICPLYYAIDERRAVFCSEAKGVLQDSSIPRRLDVEGLAETALFYGPVPPRTCFCGIFQLPPAYQLVLNVRSWTYRSCCYWEPRFLGRNFSALTANEHEAVSKLRSVMHSAVERSARHGRTTPGVCISGGLDSSIVAALAADNGVRNAFGVQFIDQEFDESRFQELVTEALGLRLRSLQCEDRIITHGLPLVVWHTECPLFRTAPIPFFYLSRLIRDTGIKAVLSGQGADELFCGYPIFLEGQIKSLFFRETQKNQRKGLQRILGRPVSLNEMKTIRETYAPSSGASSHFLSHQSRWNATSKILRVFNRERLARFTAAQAYNRLRNFMGKRREEELTSLSWAQYTELITKQAGYLLAAQGDRVFMAHGVEMRYPYLEDDVADLALQMPEDYRLRASPDKYILRKAAQGLLPPEILARPKQGYLAPDSKPFVRDSSVPEYVRYMLSDGYVRECGYFHPERVRQIQARIRHPSAAAKFYETAFLVLLSTQVLHTLFVKRDSSILPPVYSDTVWVS